MATRPEKALHVFSHRPTAEKYNKLRQICQFSDLKWQLQHSCSKLKLEYIYIGNIRHFYIVMIYVSPLVMSLVSWKLHQTECHIKWNRLNHNMAFIDEGLQLLFEGFMSKVIGSLHFTEDDLDTDLTSVGRGLCGVLITSPEESYRMCQLYVIKKTWMVEEKPQ
jgi:hypothetical protein